MLELGCGNGRVLLELIERGIDAIGIDCSASMLAQLRRKAAARGIDAHVCRMDARALGFRCAFAMVLCPYSLITYMSGTDDVGRMLYKIRRALVPGGCVVIDAFIPRPDAHSNEFKLDYRREHDQAVLTRSKRVAAIGPRLNRIERRYELVAADGHVLERIDTCEDIRLFAPEELLALLGASGSAIGETCWDYRSHEPDAEAQFFTVSARAEATA